MVIGFDRIHPIRLITGAFVLSFIAIGLFFWYVINTYQTTKTITGHDMRIVELRGIIVHLDEVLTMSAKMAAATGDQIWEKRYRLYEGRLNSAFEEAIKLAPKVVEGESVKQADSANRHLVALENEAFRLIQRGNCTSAWELLTGKEYTQYKEIYAGGMEQLSVELKHESGISLNSARRKASLATIIFPVIIALLLFVWWLVWRILRQREERKLTEHNEVLQDFNLKLQASENHLKAANLQLQASERQLKASNRQLEDKEETLLASHKELSVKMNDVSRFNKLMVGRELEMIKLKKRVQSLLEELNRPNEHEEA